jgi:hypothetical protein
MQALYVLAVAILAAGAAAVVVLIGESARLVRAKVDAVRAQTRCLLYENQLGDDWLPRK